LLRESPDSKSTSIIEDCRQAKEDPGNPKIRFLNKSWTSQFCSLMRVAGAKHTFEEVVMHPNSVHALASGVFAATPARKHLPYSETAAGNSAHAKARQRPTNGRARIKPVRMTVSDKPFVTHALDPDAGIWILHVNHTGYAVLKLNNSIVSTLSCRTGSAVLNTAACPFERAADVVAAISSKLVLAMSDEARTDFEFDLARWIPMYFDL
jgi:hypothetical protein